MKARLVFIHSLLWRRQWHPTPVLLPGKFHGQRSLVGCSPWGCEELDTTEQLHFHFSVSCIGEGNGSPLGSSVPGILQAWILVGCHFLLQCMKVKSESEVTQLCLTPSDPMDCSLPGSSVHGIFQARVLEWCAIAGHNLANEQQHPTSQMR